MMQIKKPTKIYDCIVIGSGASGGMAAWNLTRQGVNVLMLDAGDRFDRATFWTHVWPYEWRERVHRGEHPPQFFVSTKEQPYATPPDKPFALSRVWGIGGKTNVWGRVSLRYSDIDFKAAERDGWGIPWPISYKDLAPYYDKVDQLIGVCGGDDDSEILPGSKFHMPPPAERCGEKLLRGATSKLNIPIVKMRRAVMTRNHRGYPKCHYCGECGRGCDTGSFFNSADHLIPEALSTGKLEIRPNAVVARVLVDQSGKANGVQYFDRHTKEERQVRGKIIIVGASCIDSTRILLNSKSNIFPNGIGNSSGVIGKYLCEQSVAHAQAFLPQLYGREVMNDDGYSGGHIYMPRFNHRGRKRDYLRGFGMQFWHTGAIMPQPGYFPPARIPGFGHAYKSEVRRRYPSLLQLHPFGEKLPREDNYVTTEGTPLDSYGVPQAKIVFSDGENERKMVAEMYDTMEMMLHELKAEIITFERGQVGVPGSAIHEHGTCRMGADAKNSALNSFCQMHDVPNVFVVDGSAFSSASEKNPTITILALSWRATDYLADEMRKGNL